MRKRIINLLMMTCVLAGGYSQASLAQQAKSSNLTQFVNPRI